MRGWRHIAAVLAAVIGVSCGGGGSTPITPSPPVSVSSVTVSGWLAPLTPGQTVQLTATAIFSDGSTRIVTTEATWQSSDSTIALVSPIGLVVAQAGGSADVHATYQNRTGTLAITVSGPEPPGGPPVGLRCGVERWAVKTLSDPDAIRVDISRVQQTTIKSLNERATRCSGLPSSRAFAEEFEVYEVTGRVTFVRLEDDRDYHVVLADPAEPSYTIVTEVADIACQGAISSPHRGVLETARNTFFGLLGGRSPSSLVGTTVRLRGVGFYDFNHGQIGRARNCMELHPVVSISVE
jgi:hypothetical protein